MRSFGISVVIPTYGRPDVLLRAVESVQTARQHQVEVVVVDDGSTEDPLPRLPVRNANGVAVRGYRLARNRGPQAARNLGIRRARYSHIAFLDSDDEFTEDKIDIVLSALENDPCDVLFHGVRGMDRYGRLARVWDQRLRKVLPFHWLCSLYNPVVTPALVIRRQLCLGLPALRHSEDWAFLLRYVQPCTVVRYINRDLSIVYRAQGTAGGLSAAVWKMRKGEFRARQILLRRPSVSAFARYTVGALAGTARMAADALRGRYFPPS